MNKKILVIAVAALAGTLIAGGAMAKKDQCVDIPEEDGVYEVAGHPEMKVRVIVHKAKPAPAPTFKPICGVDGGSDAVVGYGGHKLPANWNYYLNINSVPNSVGGNNLESIAQRAFNVWTSQIDGKVNIAYSGTTAIARAKLDGRNIISWGNASASALAVTYIWYYENTGVTVELDTIMNKIYVWSWADQNEKPEICSAYPSWAWSDSYDSQHILTHELGHWFGLNDHYTAAYTNNTMYGYGAKGDAKYNTPTNGDIAGLRAIYGL